MSIDESLDRALALLISSTKRRNRHVSLIDIGEALEFARRQLGSLKAVGDRIGVSGKMLGQFSKVNDLSESIKSLVRDRSIDSVDTVSHLARLNIDDQEEAARRSISDGWTTDDVRAFVELRKSDKESSPQKLAERVSTSKTQREFVFEFVPRGAATPETVTASLSDWVPLESIVSVNISGSKGTLVLAKPGYEALLREAKARAIPVRRILPVLLYRL